MVLSSVITTIKQMFNGTKTPLQGLPTLLLYCTALRRSGTSAIEVASKITTQASKVLGIPAGTNEDGTPNLITAYTYLVIKEWDKARRLNDVYEVVIPPGSIMVNGLAGLVPVQATNTNFVKGIGTLKS